jgi:hypothetical protein
MEMTLISGTMVYLDNLVKEGVEMCLYNNNVTGANGLMLNQAWCLCTNIPKKAMRCPQEK